MKKLSSILVSLFALVGLVIFPVQATAHNRPVLNDSNAEKDGLYSEPGNSKVLVRVIVHHANVFRNNFTGFASTALVCGLTDNDSGSVVPAAGWKLPSQMTYRLNPTSAPSTVGMNNLATIASNGFTNWQTAVNNKVTFTRGADTITNRQAYDGKNVIAWGRASSGTLAVTYVRYNTTTHVAVDVDTIVNKAYNWSWSPTPGCAYSGVYDAQDILTHELGHWMGLADTYDAAFTDNTMYGYGSPQEVKKDTLTTGDIAGLAAIYN